MFGKNSFTFLGLKIIYLFFCLTIMMQFTFLGVQLKDLGLKCYLNEKDLIHGRVTATITEFNPQIFETYFR